jgi:hypothetical protein
MIERWASLARAFYGVLACACFCLLAAQVCLSQVAVSVLNGTVTDPSGASIPNAKITITSEAKGFRRNAQSSSNGAYTVPDLAPGVYSISVDAPGFKKAYLPEITLYVGQTSTQNFHLEVGTETQEVTVNAEVPLLNTTNGELGTVITGTLATQLPLNGRNFMQLNLLSPGAITDKTGNTSSAVSLSPAAVTFSVNGQMSDYNLYLLDGLEIKDWEAGTSMFEPSVDAVQEFQTTTSNYSAAFGAESAAQINLLVKSGTNNLHGMVWEYLRNNVLNAQDYFQPAGTSAPFKRNQFGGNIGGPVYLPRIYNGVNKTFFFFNYEGFRQAKQVPETGYYPTPAQLQGDLSALVSPGQAITNPFTGLPFPGNVIPQSAIRPATLEGFLASGIGKGSWIPAPNTDLPGINYTNVSPYNYFANQYIARVDQNIGTKSSMYGHVTYNKETRIDPTLNPSWFETESTNTYTGAGHFVHAFRPDFIFDVGLGFTHFYQNEVQSTAGKNDITNSILGIEGNATLPASWGAPVWNVAGFANLGETNFGPRLWLINIWDLRPVISLTKGKHNLQFGMDVQRVNEDVQEIFRTNGIWNYDGSFTGNSLGDFLIGLPNNVNSSPDPFSPDLFNTTLGPYFQDDWKITPKLTLNLGLRYEWVSIPLSHNHRSIANVYFPPNNGVPQIVIADDAGPIKFDGVQATLFDYPFVRASSVGLPKQLATNDFLDFSPRLGFAYSLPGAGNTVVRGAYGVFYAQDILDKWTEAAVDPPFVRSNLTVLDSTNFATFNPTNPYVNAVASAAQVFGNQVHHHLGRTQEWNLTLERTQWNTLFSIAYVGNYSDYLPDLEDPNQAVPGPGAVTSRRAWPTQGVLYIGGEHGIGNYNGLQLKAQRRYINGLEFLASYTWSKSLNTSDGTFVGEGGRGFDTQNLINPSSEYGLAAQDVAQSFTVSYIYELPFGASKRFLNQGGAVAAVLGGWQVNGITRVISGSPFSISQAANGANTDVGSFRPNRIGNPNSGPRSVAQFFNTAAYAVNAPVNGIYQFGNAGRNTVIGPGTVDSDFSLYKNIRIKERAQLQFRAEVYNIFNHPIFAQPGAELGTASFGALTSTAIDNREIQLALRLSF